MPRQGPLDVWYASLDTDALRAELATRSKRATRELDAGVAAARRRTSLQATRKLTHQIDGKLRFRADRPVLVPLSDMVVDVPAERLESAIHSTYQEYVASLSDPHRFLLGRFHIVDIAHKVVGVGSVGLLAFVVLLQSAAGVPLILQFKEATSSVLEAHLGPSPYVHPGQRIVEGQRMMQAASDIFLGWSASSIDGRHYYWRQLRDMKGSSEIESMTSAALRLYAGMCGWSLARAHARSGPAQAIAGYLGKGNSFDRAAAAFARRYADVNQADYNCHAQAVRNGRIRTSLQNV